MSRKKRRRSAHSRTKAARRAAARREQQATVAVVEVEASDAHTDRDPGTDEPAGEQPQPSNTQPAPESTNGETSEPEAALVQHPHSSPLPRSMRIILYASVGAAVLSASIASFVVFRDDGAAKEPSLVRTAAAATTADRAASASTSPAPDAAAASNGTTEPSRTLAWPDLELEQLPPTGASPPELGQSVGSPRDGALLSPVHLPNGRDYVIRNESTAWATSNTVEHLTTALRTTRRRHPTMHRVVVGDISTHRGGPLSGHTSHQSGRDVDVGLVLRGRPEDATAEFVEGNRDNLDRRATFDLITALAETRDDPEGVELIVLDYGLQRLLRRSAAGRGVPEDVLEALFQFPHGPTSRHGLVRHKPAHRDHMHVRFRCPASDRYCRDPLIGFAGMEAPEPTG